MRRTLWIGIVVGLLAGGAAACAGARRQGILVREETQGVVVSGAGDAEGRPDVANVHIGVEARRPSVAEARQRAAEAQTAVLAVLQRAGVAESDIQTAQLVVAPDFDQTEAGRRQLGYIVTNTVRVRLRRLDALGETLDHAMAAGGDAVRIEGIGFELSNPDALKARAREEATARARRDAGHLARLLGRRLGPAESVEEVEIEGGPIPMTMQLERAAGPATPVQAGVIRVRVQVRVRFSLS